MIVDESTLDALERLLVEGKLQDFLSEVGLDKVVGNEYIIDYCRENIDIDTVYDTITVERCFLENFDPMDYVDLTMYSPEDLFKVDDLEEWAYQNGFVKKGEEKHDRR